MEEPLGESAAIRALRCELRAVAPLDSTVLVTGETGVGKGVVARELHRRSQRPGPLVHVDCAALAPTLVESELFGHERGAFTGAVASRSGRFELAGDGTLWLDEIGELPPPLQAKLLRALQDRRFERIGGSRSLAVRARIVAATSRDLRREVARGQFRADLYYRLAVVHLAVPPLRARREDIPLLARAFLAALARQSGRAAPRPGRGFFERLAGHPWPGNARELQNALERLLVRHAGERVGARELDAVLERPAAVETHGPSPERIESVLRETGGNVARAARELGLPRTTLRRRIRERGC